MRVVGNAFLALLMLSLVPMAGHAGKLRITAWNLEHLDDDNSEGCVGRTGADYVALARRIEELGADIVAFQEVENAAAARRVFPASDWHVELHSVASQAIVSGENLPLVGALLGHRRWRTTADYVHVADEHLVEAAESVGCAIAAMLRRDLYLTTQ